MQTKCRQHHRSIAIYIAHTLAEMSTNGIKQQLHVAMFPWLAFGHIIPFLDLSKFIAEKGHKVSFLSTTRNIKRLPEIPSHLTSLIHLVPLTLPRVQELPQDAEATMDVPTDDIQHLKKAFDGLQQEVTLFLEAESPDWIIYDFGPYWLPPVASGLGISGAFFSIINAWFITFVGGSPEDLINGTDDRKTVDDFLTPPKWVRFPTKICYRKHEANWMVGTGTANSSGVTDMYRLGKVLQGVDCMFIRHCYEFEPLWLPLLEELHHLPVIPVGLMPPNTTTTDIDVKDDTWLTIKKWLDGQEKGHVVYVALGSEVMLDKMQLDELALGLEVSGVPFFWAFRKPAGSETMELPDGFLERTQIRGVVWRSWVPQLKILGHESIGGFLTHCGWSSIVEGLMLGHPLIMLPFLVDQGLNARAMVEKQVGVEVPRNDQDGSFTRNSVANSITSVVIGDQGKIYKGNAMELSQIFSDTKLHKKYIDDFIDYLQEHRRIVNLSSVL